MSTQEPPDNAPNPSTPTDLTDLDKQVLEFAGLHWKYTGAMETAIRERFGWSPARYYQVLNHLIDQPQAHAHDPLLISRLRRLRDERQQQRRPRTDTSGA